MRYDCLTFKLKYLLLYPEKDVRKICKIRGESQLSLAFCTNLKDDDANSTKKELEKQDTNHIAF